MQSPSSDEAEQAQQRPISVTAGARCGAAGDKKKEGSEKERDRRKEEQAQARAEVVSCSGVDSEERRDGEERRGGEGKENFTESCEECSEDTSDEEEMDRSVWAYECELRVRGMKNRVQRYIFFLCKNI